jgi:cytoskeletal protein CcmA (bactofilin family)
VCKGISIRGQVTGSEDLQIDGEVSGTVQLAGGRVMIGPEGRVAGNIDAREIIVRGELKGNLRAVERILVGGTGRWQGDGISPRLGIEEGALLKGKFEVSLEEAKKPAVPKTVAAKPASVAGKETSVPTGAAAGIGNGNAGNAGGAGQVVSAEVNETTAAKAGTVPSNTLNG